MGEILRYFRTHRWQRRALTLLIALVAGAAVAVGLYPTIRREMTVYRLGSDDPARWWTAVFTAETLAKDSPGFVSRLEAELDTLDDRRFVGVVTVLRRLARFDVPGRDPIHIDRNRSIELTWRDESDDAQAIFNRRMILARVVLSGRDNRYVRAALATATGDPAGRVRELAPLLAARLGDADAMRTLLDDEDPAVAAAAVLDAGLAQMTALAEPIAERLAGADDLEWVSAAAFALATLDAETYGGRIAAMLAPAEAELLRDRLLHVMTVLDNDDARAAVRQVLARFAEAGEIPPAAAILAAGKLRIDAVGPIVRDGLAGLTAGESEPTEGQVLAMLAAADALDMPIRAELYTLCEKLWNPRRYQVLLRRSARMLGRQARTPQADRPMSATQPDAEVSEDECFDLLRRLALYAVTVESAGGPIETLRTPLPSAAAAAQCWLLRPNVSVYKKSDQPSPDDGRIEIHELDLTGGAYYVRLVAGLQDQWDAGDYLAWRLGRSGEPKAFDLAREMLPPPHDPYKPPHVQPDVVYSEAERTAGAMLLALSARGDEQLAFARRRLRERLAGGPAGPEQDFYEAGSYRCALLLAGDDAQAPAVRELLGTGSFPVRRALTALCGAGDWSGLDWLLWGPDIGRQGMANLLVDDGFNEVLAATAPWVGGVDAAAPTDLLGWQMQIVQDAYALGRARRPLGLDAVGGER